MTKTEQCPKCGDNMKKPRVALSRRDNKSNICPPCGTREAMEDFMKYYDNYIDQTPEEAMEDFMKAQRRGEP